MMGDKRLDPGGTSVHPKQEYRPLPTLLEELRRDYVLVEKWSSRTSRLSRWRSTTRQPSELVVKVCDRWESTDARICFESARRLASLEGSGRARVVEFLAWSASPPALISEFVGGEELGALVQKTAGHEEIALGEFVFAAGELLGHAHLLPIPVGAKPKAPRQSFPRPVLSAGDFAPYNFRLDSQGRLVYLEPPSKLRIVSAFHDLAWFLASIPALVPGRAGLRRQLQRNFVRGYRGAMVDRSWGPLAEVYLQLYLLRRRRGSTLRSRRLSQRDVGATRRPSTRD